MTAIDDGLPAARARVREAFGVHGWNPSPLLIEAVARAAREDVAETVREHTTRWGVLSEDDQVYGVKPNTRETAETECRLLREEEPGAMVHEARTCGWAGVRLHDPAAIRAGEA